MFGHTSFSISPQEVSTPPKPSHRVQSPRTVKARVLPTSRSPPLTLPSGVPTRTVIKKANDSEVSERFKNPAYNRQPSPTGRFMYVGRANKDPTTNKCEAPNIKERIESNPKKPAVSHSPVAECRSDVMRQKLETKPLEEESKIPVANFQRTRPRTTEYRKVDDSLSCLESLSFENRVLLAVKEVLSRAVIEKGKIDENNIGIIIDDMKNRLLGQETSDSEDEVINLDVKLKQSTTRLNVEFATKNEMLPNSKAKPLAGIVRRNIVDPPKKVQKIFKKIQKKDESSSPMKTTLGLNNFSNSQDSLVYIDLPDYDYSNFNSIVKREEEVLQKSKQKKQIESKSLEEPVTKKDQQSELTEKMYALGDSRDQDLFETSFIQEKGGDCQFSACQPHAWKTIEDIKLQNYIEALIRGMNEQLKGKIPNRVSDVDTEETFCKSFCVCKVCVSNKATSSRRTLNENSSNSNVVRKSHSDLKMKNSIMNNVIAATNTSKLRQSKALNKESNRESNFRILQRNANFHPDSKLNLASRYVMEGPLGPESKLVPNSRDSYVTVDSEEAKEDLYLRRRINKTPIKRRMSTRI